ncbi:MAG: hypothetical protein FP824_06185 [Euryarchaeota archaeon]|nr:hypothetical protein [Euryarchaeota archaeon]MBU4032940.1 hypothetical protein [Candidatus Thermoplasmatota archaeon]MBU4144240.1 hypothetical protein [Candidatus Thermoplasmatota archaeon]
MNADIELSRKFNTGTIVIFLFYSILITILLWVFRDENYSILTFFSLIWGLFLLPVGTMLLLAINSHYYSQFGWPKWEVILIIFIILIINYCFDFSFFLIDNSEMPIALIFLGMVSLIMMSVGWSIGIAFVEKMPIEISIDYNKLVDNSQIFQIHQAQPHDFNQDAIFRKYVGIIKKDYGYHENWSKENSVILERTGYDSNRLYVSKMDTMVTVLFLNQNGKRTFYSENEELVSEIDVVSRLFFQFNYVTLESKQILKIKEHIKKDLDDYVTPSDMLETIKSYVPRLIIIGIIFGFILWIFISWNQIRETIEQNTNVVVIGVISGLSSSIVFALFNWLYKARKQLKK